MNHKGRIKHLRTWLAAHKADALLLTHPPDVRYLCGFSGSHALLLVLPRATILLTDGRYQDQSREQTEGSGVRVVIGRQLLQKACALLLRAAAASVAYDSETTSVAALASMEAALPPVFTKAARRAFFTPLSASPVAALREIKDGDELQRMEAAAALGCRIFDATLEHLAAGVSEQEIAARLEYAARQMGADGMSFETIVASGQRSALPHGHATAQPLPRRGLVTMDFGVILHGYCSDMTRTLSIGQPTHEERAVYAAVLAAEQAGIAAVRANIPASRVDRAARALLRRRGWGKYFSHSTGHGVGLAIHEGPRLSATSQDTLAAGMVVTVEPGVYLPHRFGVRIEDMVVVEANGSRLLTPAPKELLTIKRNTAGRQKAASKERN